MNCLVGNHKVNLDKCIQTYTGFGDRNIATIYDPEMSYHKISYSDALFELLSYLT